MATYTWKSTTTGGDWTVPSNWNLNSSYPQLSTDVAYGSSSTAPITVTLNTNIGLATLRDAPTLHPFNVAGTGTINFSSTGILQGTTGKSALTVNTISARINSGSSALQIRGDANGYWKLTNTSNSIYQIAVASATALGFDSASCLSISHPQYIFSRTSTSVAVRMFCTGSGGTISKTFWGTAGGYLGVFSNGTGPIKIGIAGGTSVPVSTNFVLDGTLAPQSDTNDNQLLDNFTFSGFSVMTKNGACRWILSGILTGTLTTVSIPSGILQFHLSGINSSSITSITVSSGCLELHGSGTVASPVKVTLSTGAVGPSGIGALRATTNSSITISTITLNNNNKLAAATGATLTIPTFTSAPTNTNITFGGEGTVDFQYALAGTSTSVAITKEDSGTLKMSTNDKTYAAPTNINGGTVLCDGFNRISQSNLVTVANGARLRANYSGIETQTTVLSLKGLTLNAGSVIQVG